MNSLNKPTPLNESNYNDIMNQFVQMVHENGSQKDFKKKSIHLESFLFGWFL